MRNQIICAVVILITVLTIPALAEWTTPVPVTAVNTSSWEGTPFLSNDKLTLYFSRIQTWPSSPFQTFSVTRSDISSPFGSVKQAVNANGIFAPWVSPDNLRMYYSETYYSGGYTHWGVKYSQRASANDTWSDGSWISELNTSTYASFPTMTADELTIMFNVSTGYPGSSTYDIYTASRLDKNSSFSNIKKVTELCSNYNDTTPSLTSDGLSVVFASNRGDHITDSIYMASRQSLTDPFSNLTRLSMFDFTGGSPEHPSFSADGKELYYVKSYGSNLLDVYVSYNVPEPATLILLGLGGLTVLRNRRR